MKNYFNLKMREVKDWIKKNRYSSNIVVRKCIEILYCVIKPIYTIKGILFDKKQRSVFITKLSNKDCIHQTNIDTCYNRYPVIFSACRQYFEERENITILSFGCSTGEEVVTLRHYFPNATIIGTDINKRNLEICKERHLDEKIHFIESTSDEIKKYAPFDAIFCMAVFQRTPSLIYEKKITDLKKIYPFEKFEKQIIELDSYIEKNGLFIIHFSQYYLKDTRVAHKYIPYGQYNQDEYTWYIFDKNSKLIKERIKRFSIFIKKSN